MIPSAEDYRRNPGRSGSLAHWKQRALPHLSGLREVHAEEDPGGTGTPERYFKLTRSLDHVPEPTLAPEIGLVGLSPQSDDGRIARVINESYPTIRVTADEVRSWGARAVHTPELWIGADVAGELVGCAVTDVDPVVGEAALDWLQVLPSWRGRGIATALVYETLRRAARTADFATVSGDVDNESAPERVYRRCGFTGSDVWHIYRG